jgi:hypothetical protein
MIDILGRAKILLKATKELLEKQENSHYVMNLLEQTVFYDGVDCDGSCLKDDIGYWFDELENTSIVKEIPLNRIKQAREEIQKLRGCSCSCSDGIIDDVEDILDKLIESEV